MLLNADAGVRVRTERETPADPEPLRDERRIVRTRVLENLEEAAGIPGAAL
jgi:hypothetical protein